MEVNERVDISLAVGDYLRAKDRFTIASDIYTKSCRSLRERIKPNMKGVVKIEYQYYLVTSDDHGTFLVEEIECL